MEFVYFINSPFWILQSGNMQHGTDGGEQGACDNQNLKRKRTQLSADRAFLCMFSGSVVGDNDADAGQYLHHACKPCEAYEALDAD